MNVQIDISEEDVKPDLGIAQDGPGDRYLLLLGDLELTINYDQLQSIYQQVSPWFVEDAA